MTHHGAGLRKLKVPSQLIDQLKIDYRDAELTGADRAMLDYAVKLTREPHHISRQDIDTLHKAGFSESAILDICQVAAYFNFVNRLADGLGVELENYWQEEDLLPPPE